LPTLIEFDTFYYYGFDSKDDDSVSKGSISILDIFIDKLSIETISND